MFKGGAHFLSIPTSQLCLRSELDNTVGRPLPTLLSLRLLWGGFHGWSDSWTPSGGKKKCAGYEVGKSRQGGGSSQHLLSANMMGTSSRRPQATWSHLTPGFCHLSQNSASSVTLPEPAAALWSCVDALPRGVSMGSPSSETFSPQPFCKDRV